MKGFLARWVEETESVAHCPSDIEPKASVSVQAIHNAATTVPSDLQSHSSETGTHGMPWADWKASQLNEVFREQGVTGRPSRITPDTVRCSRNHEVANETRQGADKTTHPPPPHETAHLLAGEDSALTGARSEIIGLVAIAYRRHAGIQRVGPDQPQASAELANSGPPSVHGGVS